MKTSRWVRIVLCVVALASAGRGVAAAAEAAKDALASRGLAKAGTTYVLAADEAAVVNGMKALRDAKAASDKEVKARAVLDGQVAAKQKVLKDSDKQWHELETRLPLVQKVDAHNAIVVRMNRLVADHKQAMLALKDLDEQAGKLSVTAKTKFVDQLMAMNAKAAAATAKYAEAAADPAVKAALAKANAAATPKVALGPSPAFAAAIEELKKWQGAVEAEAIPLRAEQGTFAVDVLINGERLLMAVDTGASTVSLTSEAADKLKVTPGPDAPVVQMRIANGMLIEGKEVTLNSVRVGRFTVENVRCVVLQPGLPDAPLLLGGSFLNHFIVKLDPAKQELQLAEIRQDGAAKPTKPTGAATPASVAPAK